MAVTSNGNPVKISTSTENVVQFGTKAGGIYLLEPKNN
jgi:hypothetical protein